MKIFSCVLMLFIMLPSLAYEGELYGTVKMGDKAIPQGVKVIVTINTEEGVKSDSTITNKFGSYNLYLKESGRCTIIVCYPQDKRLAFDKAYSDAEGCRYNLNIKEIKKGEFKLERK